MAMRELDQENRMPVMEDGGSRLTGRWETVDHVEAGSIVEMWGRLVVITDQVGSITGRATGNYMYLMPDGKTKTQFHYNSVTKEDTFRYPVHQDTRVFIPNNQIRLIKKHHARMENIATSNRNVPWAEKTLKTLKKHKLLPSHIKLR